MSNPVLRMAASPTLHSCPSRRKNRQLLLPRLGKGWDGECPVSFLSSFWTAERDSESPASSEWRKRESSLRLEAMRERMRTKPVRWRETMSFPTARIIQFRHGVPCTNRQCVTPCFTKRTAAAKWGRVSLYAELTRSLLRVLKVLKLFSSLWIVQQQDTETGSRRYF